MPIYIESRNLDAIGGFVAEHQYLIYVPEGQELNYDAWQYIGAFPSNGDGSFLTRKFTDGSLFNLATADRWSTADFLITEVEAVATILDIPLAEVTISNLVTEGYAGTAESFRHRETVSTLNDLWNYLEATADDISGKYTYNAQGVTGTSSVYGPSVNSNSFISSILRHAKVAGYDISAFDTDANVVGNKTWLGTTGDDVMDGRIQFANGDEVHDLYGGRGADTLYAGTNSSYLVAGDDTDRDTLIGNSGNDILVGYFNQNNLGQSDKMLGGGGDDTFVIIDPATALAGGIPDIQRMTSALSVFTHAGGQEGLPTLIDGGSGYDILDYSFLHGNVTVDFNDGSIANIEDYQGSSGNDTVFAGEGSYSSEDGGLTALEGSGGNDLLSYRFFTDNVKITFRQSGISSFDSVEAAIQSNGENWLTGFHGFELIEGSSFSDLFLLTGVLESYDITGLYAGKNLNEVTFSPMNFAGQSTENIEGIIGDVLSLEGLSGLDGADNIYIELDNINTDDIDDGILVSETTFMDIVGFEHVFGSGAADTIYGNGALNWLFGFAGDDVLVGREGGDLLAGGVGADILVGGNWDGGSFEEYDNDGIGDVLIGDEGDDIFLASNNDLIVDKSFADYVSYQGFGSNGDGTIYFAGEKLIGGVEIDIKDDYNIADQGVFYDADNLPFIGFRDHDAAMLYYVYDFYETVNVIASDGSSTVVTYNSYKVGVVNQNTKEVIEIYDFNFDFDDHYHSGIDPEHNCFGEFLGVILTVEPESDGGNNGGNYKGTKDDDFYRAGDGDDTFAMGDGNDYGDGGGGSDTMKGQKGDDTLQGGADGDTLDGGLGNDTAEYRTSNQGVTVHLNGPVYGGHATGDTLISIENLSGSSLADTLFGDAADNILIGRKGDDTFWGGGGDDIIDGGEGFDTVNFSNSGYTSVSALFIDLSADTIAGATTDGDTYISIEGWAGTELNDSMSGDENSNSFAGRDGDDTLTGLAGDDFLWGNSGNDAINGGSGSDFLYGGNGVDNIFGGDGNDYISGDNGNDIINAGDGNDTIFGGNGVDIVTGGSGNDIFAFYQLYAYNNVGIIDGDRDIITDFVSGEDKFDLYHLDAKVGQENFEFDPSTPPVNDPFEFIGTAAFTVGFKGELRYAHENGNTILYAEVTGDGIADYAIELTGIHYLTSEDFTGPSLKSPIYGTDNNETINGTSEGDTIFALAGDDIVYGGDGSDGIYGDDGNDVLYGGYGDDTIYGGSGNDHIYGGFGIDTIYGGDGDDIFYDSHGSTDIMDGGNGIDTLDISTSSVGATIDLISGTVDWNNTLTDIAINFENVNSTSGDDTIYGTNGANIINGKNGNDTIYGNDGNDTINGWYGADLLFGGLGDDIITGHSGLDYMDGGLGNDTVDFAYSVENVDIDLELGHSTFTSGTVETTINFENAIGSEGDNVIVGTVGSNILDGNNGNDTLIGKAGDDTLIGGIGQDTFVFSTGDGHDIITDFNPLEDSILIDGIGIVPLNWAAGVTVVEQLSGHGDPELLITYGQEDTILIQNVSLSTWVAAEYNIINGTALDDIITGTNGADYIESGDGNDEVTAGDGDDVVYGGLGADTIWLDEGNDVFYDDAEGGASGNDTVYGGAGVDTLNGAGGDDNFFGGNGKDTLIGGKGKDTLKGGNGNDTLKGGNGADALIGGAKNDTMIGNGGKDILTGGTGNDKLTGGAGSDIFTFKIGDELDTIKDFEDGIDVIDFSATNLTFADLTITNSVDGATITYAADGSDKITLTGIDAATMDQTDFLFA